MTSSPSFLQLQRTVDTGRRGNHDVRASAVSPSALAKLLRREKFTSAPLDGSATAPTAQKGSSDTFTYRASLNLKWKSKQFAGAGDASTTSPTLVDESTMPQSSTKKIEKPPSGNNRQSTAGSVFWRECRMEAFVRREAVFYNYLLSKSSSACDAASSSTGPLEQSVSPGAGLASSDPEGSLNSVQVDQPSTLSLLWDVSRVAATSHLLGGDGSFFLRKEFMKDGSACVPQRSDADTPSSTSRGALATIAVPISINHVLKLFGNEKTFQPIQEGDPANRLHRATSYLLTESYECTLTEFLQLHMHQLDAVQITDWCRIIAQQLSEMHRAGVLHNNIHADSIVLCHPNRREEDGGDGDDCEAHSGDGSPDNCSTTTASSRQQRRVHSASVAQRVGPSTRRQEFTVKLSWLYCATMSDLQVVRGLRKQTLSQSRSDPAHSEYHLLSTAHLPEALTSLAKTYPSVLPPEWFSVSSSTAKEGSGSGAAAAAASTGLDVPQQTLGTNSYSSSASLRGKTDTGSNVDEPLTSSPTTATARRALRLRPTVTPTSKSDAYLFGKFLQQLYTNTMVEFNSQSVVSVSSYYLSKTTQASFTDCPSKLGKLCRIDEINSESLRHLIMAATMEDLDLRWSIRELACHPFFWQTETIMEFMTCVAEFAFPANANDASSTKHQVRKSLAASTTEGHQSLRDSFKETVQKSQSQQATKKMNITAPELAALRGISKPLSTWAVEPRNWITNDVVNWVEAICFEARDFGTIRTIYENQSYQQIEFLINVYTYLRDTRRIPAIAGGDPDKFVSLFVHRFFPTLLMEATAMTMNEEDAPKFARFVAAKIRLGVVAKRSAAVRRESLPHLQLILSVAESLSREKAKSVVATGYDHIVQYVGAFPQFPVHVAESEKVQVVKKSQPNKPRGKPNISHLPKWAQLQIEAADV